jgi:hypothetical protein
MRTDLYHDKRNKLVVYEEMIDGKSYLFIRSNGELVQIGMPQWRKVVAAWQEKGWDKKWDYIDDCVPVTAGESNNDNI